MWRVWALAGIAATVLAGCDASDDTAGDGASEAVASTYRAPVLKGLGDYSYKISAANDDAQMFFDQGLALLYGYQRMDAADAFAEAARLDPNCGMCFWGIAVSQGPYPNGPLSAAGNVTALEAIDSAASLADSLPAHEGAFIDALTVRYSAKEHDERAVLDQAFVDAMRDLVASYPGDDEAVMMLVEALMTTTPWNYWEDPEQANPTAQEAIRLCEMVLERNPEHIGAIHYLIHLTEASSNPKRAESAADRMAALVPGLHHLVHMPGHTYLRVGRYDDAIKTNLGSVEAIEAFNEQLTSQGFESDVRALHAVDFILTATRMTGRSANADYAADELLLLSSDLSTATYFRLPILREARLLTYLRFGKWSEILAAMGPMSETPFSQAIYHLAAGTASARTGRIELAENELIALEAIEATFAEQGAAVFPMPPTYELVQMASFELKAAIATAKGSHDLAVDMLREAVTIQDAMYYVEPPHWYMPLRHRLGAALLDAGRYEEARDVYLNDLEHWPEDGWALKGLTIALDGLGDLKGSANAQARFEAAWAFADVTIPSSAF